MYTVTLDPNGGCWSSDDIGSFTIHVGESKDLPAYVGISPEGLFFAGWSYSDGRADGEYIQYTQTLDHRDASVFEMTLEVAENASGNCLVLYAVWIPLLVTLPCGEVMTEAAYKTGDEVVLDLRLPHDISAGVYLLKAGSVPYYVPAEHEGFQFRIEDGICTITSSEYFPGSGNLRFVIPVLYSTESEGYPSDDTHILVEWIVDAVFVATPVIF